MLPRTDTQPVRGNTAEHAEGSAKDGHGTVDGFQCWPIKFNLCWRYFVCLLYILYMMAGNHLLMYVNLNCECS